MNYKELNEKIKENKFIELTFDEIKDIKNEENKVLFIINNTEIEQKDKKLLIKTDKYYAFKYNDIIYIVDNKNYYKYLTCEFKNEKEIYLCNANNLFNQYNFYLDSLKQRINEGENSDIYLHQVNKTFDKYNETLKELKNNIIEEKEKELKTLNNKWITWLIIVVVGILLIGCIIKCFNCSSKSTQSIQNNEIIKVVDKRFNKLEKKISKFNIKIDEESKISKKYFYELKYLCKENKKSSNCCININCNKGN